MLRWPDFNWHFWFFKKRWIYCPYVGPPPPSFSHESAHPTKCQEDLSGAWLTSAKSNFLYQNDWKMKSVFWKEHPLYSNIVMGMLKVVNFLQILMGSWVIRLRSYNFFKKIYILFLDICKLWHAMGVLTPSSFIW